MSLVARVIRFDYQGCVKCGQGKLVLPAHVLSECSRTFPSRDETDVSRDVYCFREDGMGRESLFRHLASCLDVFQGRTSRPWRGYGEKVMGKRLGKKVMGKSFRSVPSSPSEREFSSCVLVRSPGVYTHTQID